MSFDPSLPLTGADTTITIFINGSPVQDTDLAKQWSLTEVNKQYRDGYMGSDTQRTDEKTLGWDAKIDLDYAGSALIKALLAQKAARAAKQPVPVISITFTLSNRDGSADGLILQNCTTKMDLNFKSQEERGMVSLAIQAQTLKPVTL